MTVGAQVWTHLNCLKEGGFPALLWDTLKDFGYTAYPEYSTRELMTTGQLLRWEVKVKIPMCPTVRHGYPWVPTDQSHGRPRQMGPAY
jgi:hypothetical protein